MEVTAWNGYIRGFRVGWIARLNRHMRHGQDQDLTGFGRTGEVPGRRRPAKRQFDGSVCAICMETIQGEGGIRPVSREFLQRARMLSESTGALLILDEIQCGLGRTGRYFAYQHYGVEPDIVTVAKPLAAGLPLEFLRIIEAHKADSG